MSAPAPFDPWSATVDDAVAADSSFEIDGPEGPLFQWQAVQNISAMRERAEQGDGFAVLDAVSQCIRHGLKVPDWLARMFLRRYDAVLNCRAGSWDDAAAFGRPYPQRTEIALLRLRRIKRLELQSYFLRQDAPPRTKAGFALAAKALGITPTQARNWTPRTRKNVRGHKPYSPTASNLGTAHNPFGLSGRKPR